MAQTTSHAPASQNATPTSTAPASPFTPSPVFGKYDSTRMSTFGFAYANDTVPTPWPYLAASLALSVVLAFFSIGMEIVFEKKQNRRKRKGLPLEQRKTWGKGKAIVSLITIAIGVIRSVSLLISTAKAEAGTGGRYSSPSVLVVLFFSIFVQMCDQGIPHPSILLVIWLELACVFTSMIITGYRGFFISTPKRAYAKLFPSGGSCPQIVGSCYRPDPEKLGCELAFDHTRNSSAVVPSFDQLSLDADYILVQELIWTIFIHLIGFGFLVIVLGSLGGLSSHKGWLKPWRFGQNVDHVDGDHNSGATSAAEQGHSGIMTDKSTPIATIHNLPPSQGAVETTPTNSRKKKDTVCERFSNLMWAMFIFAAATFTVHYFQETRPKGFFFTDGSGPIGAKGSWSDCFRTSAPKDHYGFWDAWSAAQKGQVENLLAFV